MRFFFILFLIAMIAGYTEPVFSADSTGAQAAGERLGIETGYFSCTLPEGWTRQENDDRDERSYMLIFYGPRAESSPVMIHIEYFAEDNTYFNGYEDFMESHTYDPWEEKSIAEAKETSVNGIKGVWFEREQETSLSVESPSSETVMIKEKFYVFFGKDQKGFFVLHYYAPSSVFSQHLEKFEIVAKTFKLL